MTVELDIATAEGLYRSLYRGRKFDEIVIALQRQGAVSGYAQALGQEAAQVGAVSVLEPTDMVFPSYRQPVAAMHRGVTPTEILRYHSRQSSCPWDWRGLRFGPYTIPIGSQLAHATGWALAETRRATGSVTLVFFGDGASSQGEVHEAMNLAGVLQAPIVFLCENNGWAISMPFAGQTAASALYVRALGYGIRGEQVDGNDLMAVRESVARAVTAARAGLGPTLIEAVTYRLGGHTTNDDPTLYREEVELQRKVLDDPVERFKSYCQTKDVLAQESIQAIREDVDRSLRSDAERFAKEFSVGHG
jgi:TPP-dependent pyruvate/acetoin dehydrogenase alpha subunit